MNECAIRVYEACGFVREATLRDRSFKDGGWIHRVVMSVTREEFEAAQQRLEQVDLRSSERRP